MTAARATGLFRSNVRNTEPSTSAARRSPFPAISAAWATGHDAGSPRSSASRASGSAGPSRGHSRAPGTRNERPLVPGSGGKEQAGNEQGGNGVWDGPQSSRRSTSRTSGISRSHRVW